MKQIRTAFYFVPVSKLKLNVKNIRQLHQTLGKQQQNNLQLWNIKIYGNAIFFYKSFYHYLVL